MKAKFYQTSQENIETLLKYYESANTKIKKYYNKMIKYKKLTNEYCSKIKQLFFEENNIFNLNSSSEDFETIEIDYGITNKEVKNKLLSGEIYEKRINMTPIINSIEKINKFFNEYVTYIQLFINSLEIPLTKLNQCIEVTNSEINSVKNNHNIQLKNFILKYCEYDVLNKDLSKLYNKTEKKLIEYCSDKKNKKKKKQELDKIDEKLNLFMTNSIQNEKEILNKYNSIENFEKIFDDSTNEKINTIKDFTSSLFQKFDNFLRNVYNFFKKSFMMPMDQLLSQRKDISINDEIKLKKNFDDLIDTYVNKIDSNNIKNNLDIYSPKIIKKKNDDKELNVDKKLRKQISFEILSFDKDFLEEEDIYFIVKKMYYSFSLINIDNYNLEIEEKKLEIKKIFNKLISYGTYRKKRNSCVVKDWNFLDEPNIDIKDKEIKENNSNVRGNENTEEKKEDKKEDKEEDNNKDKIKDKKEEKNEDKKEEIKENEENKNKKGKNSKKNIRSDKELNNIIIDCEGENNIIIDNDKITQQDIDYLCKYMIDVNYQRYFLIKLNNYRTSGNFEMPLNIFNYVKQILCEILKNIEQEKKYEEKGNILELENTKLVIILSQTFYCVKEEQKYYLQKELKNEKIFKNTEYWKKILEISIEIELNSFLENCKINNKNLENEESMKEKKNSIAFAQMLPYINNMNEFGVDLDEIKDIISPFIEKYEVSEENKKIMFDLIREN